VRVCENPVMSIPNKTRINTELFIDSTAAIYIRETRVRVGANKSYQRFSICLLEEQVYTLHRNAILD